mmetsp:Transcript_27892/g.89041  ORF Transcript_27892/g.89041 Transcript_27892/m.89041 type:complete len:218 (-) Transcript_27892:214-867(-)
MSCQRPLLRGDTGFAGAVVVHGGRGAACPVERDGLAGPALARGVGELREGAREGRGHQAALRDRLDSGVGEGVIGGRERSPVALGAQGLGGRGDPILHLNGHHVGRAHLALSRVPHGHSKPPVPRDLGGHLDEEEALGFVHPPGHAHAALGIAGLALDEGALRPLRRVVLVGLLRLVLLILVIVRGRLAFLRVVFGLGVFGLGLAFREALGRRRLAQ